MKARLLITTETDRLDYRQNPKGKIYDANDFYSRSFLSDYETQSVPVRPRTRTEVLAAQARAIDDQNIRRNDRAAIDSGTSQELQRAEAQREAARRWNIDTGSSMSITRTGQVQAATELLAASITPSPLFFTDEWLEDDIPF